MNYLDVYFSRINHMGDSTAERIKNGGIRSFQKWLDESPHTVCNLSVERGIYFDGIILTNKDKEAKKILQLNVGNDVSIVIGDIINWQIEDGSIEKWLIFQEEKKVNGTYKTFFIVRCNYLIKWINTDGHLQQSWSYIVSSVDSKIKGNFRTWNNLITPQPNKYAEILMPRYPIERSTTFIVEDEAWIVVEYDHTSVPGVIYLSLTESKINTIYDDTINNIADLDKLAQYDFDITDTELEVSLGAHINPIFTLFKNGQICDEPTEIISSNTKVIKNINGEMIAISKGTADLIIRLIAYPDIKQNISITVVDTAPVPEFSAYVEGPDSIKLDRLATYTLKGNQEIENTVTYSLPANNVYAAIVNVENNICTIRANDQNKLGTIILTASYNNNTYTKEIRIIPLW